MTKLITIDLYEYEKLLESEINMTKLESKGYSIIIMDNFNSYNGISNITKTAITNDDIVKDCISKMNNAIKEKEEYRIKCDNIEYEFRRLKEKSIWQFMKWRKNGKI